MLLSQIHEYDVEEVPEEIEEITEVPFAVVGKAPVYPGCTAANEKELKKCTSVRITAFVKDKFNRKKMLKNLEPKKYRTFASFKINKEGGIQDIKTRVPNKLIEEEVIRVLKTIPTLTPGEYKGKVVNVLYRIAIIFEINENNDFSFVY